jgi:hypothetical protein
MFRAALWLLTLFTPASLFAQAISAKVIGTVTDHTTGGVVPAAVLTLRNQQTTQTREAKTDDSATTNSPSCRWAHTR